jgi:hypothetical protein
VNNGSEHDKIKDKVFSQIQCVTAADPEYFARRLRTGIRYHGIYGQERER